MENVTHTMLGAVERRRRKRQLNTSFGWLPRPFGCSDMIAESNGAGTADGSSSGSAHAATTAVTTAAAAVYVLSGICQPLLLTECKNAGLADSTAQLYMLFYYAGPSLLLATLLPCCNGASSSTGEVASLPSAYPILKACFIAGFDIAAQSFNYTGASMAGATVFAVVYSSVTVWTAIFSRVFYGRSLSTRQCFAIALVVAGLCVTALDSVNLGQDVARGTAYVILGSCMHGGTYVMSEAIMTKAGNQYHTTIHQDHDDVVGTKSVSSANAVKRDLLTVRENSAIQGVVACASLFIWQVCYTFPRWNALIREPMRVAGTTTLQATVILLSFGLANLLHSFSFYHTLAHYPGGSTSAGVMKGLQAVLVFVVAHLLYCTKTETDLCFSMLKFASLATVVSGVILYSMDAPMTRKFMPMSSGYSLLGDAKIRTPYEGPV